MNGDAAVDAMELLARASIEVTSRALVEATSGEELSLLQWRALRIIGDESAGARVGQVGDGVGVPLPAASRLVQRLRQRRLVSVERDPDDGRALRVRLTPAGNLARSTVLDRRRDVICDALRTTVLTAEAVQGLCVVAERLAQASREMPARGLGSLGGLERRTMNGSDTHQTIKTGTFAEGEETMPEKDAQDRVLRRGNFAAGEETKPDENAERRVHARGGFALGQEDQPQEDAEKRAHPGTFGDREPTA